MGGDGWLNQVEIRLTQLSTGLKVEAELGNNCVFCKALLGLVQGKPES